MYGKHGQYIIVCPHHVTPVEIYPEMVPAASIINWSHEAEPVLNRKKALKPPTLARIRKGLRKYGRVEQVVDLARTHTEQVRSRPVQLPLFTQTQAQTLALFDPLVVQLSHPEAEGRRGGEKAWPATMRPLPTQTSRADLGLAMLPGSFLVKLYGTSRVADCQRPTPTITSSGEHIGVVQHAFFAPYNGESNPRTVDKPVPTLTQVERLGMVRHPQRLEALSEAAIEELLHESTFRMLEPSDELLRAMDLARYELEGTRRDKTAMIGNAVVAEVARQIGLAIRAAYYGADEAARVARWYPERRSRWMRERS